MLVGWSGKGYPQKIFGQATKEGYQGVYDLATINLGHYIRRE